MSKDSSKLDEELNENLDFLEEDPHAAASVANTTAIKTTTNMVHPTRKQIMIIALIGIIGVFLTWKITHNKKKTSLKTTHNNSAIGIKNKFNELQVGSGAHKEPSIDSIQKDQTKLLQSPSQQTSTNDNLTWQELQKNIIEEITTPPSNLKTEGQPNDALTQSETTVIVNGFEKSINNEFTQIAPSSMQANYKIQESIIELKNIIANITADLTENVKQIKELQNNLREISNSISSVNDTVGGVDYKILQLTQSLDNLSVDVKNVKKYIHDEDLDLTTSLKPAEPDLFSNSPEYVIHAVIPGRAWLKSSSGQIITVTEGDPLGDYGKIAMIDATNNIVRTSSGIVFR